MTQDMDDRNAVAAETFSHADPVVDAALDWFFRLRDAAAGAEEHLAFAEWMTRDPRHEAEFLRLESMWGDRSFHDSVVAARPERAGVATLPTSPRPGWRRVSGAVIGTAAAAALAVALWQGPGLWRIWNADHATQTGQRASMDLPDGSVMLLNTATAVMTDFEDGRREVQVLAGEAWFEVQPDAAHPFRVTGRYGTVTVTGTAFGLRSEDSGDTVILERGSVEVSGQGAQPAVTLAPGQMVTVDAGGTSAVTAVDTGSTLAWRDGRLVFDDWPLAAVVDELKRYSGGMVILAGSHAAGMRVSGSYSLDDIDTAFAILAQTSGLRMTRIPGGLTILR